MESMIIEQQLLAHIAAGREKNPDGIAVWSEEGSLTRTELDSQSNQLARHLREMGVGPEVMVGLFAERSCELVLGLLGIVKAGGVYVPLDPDYPAERLKFMMIDAATPIVLTQARLADRLPETNANIVCLDRDLEKIAAHSSDPLVVDIDPDNLIYMIYTSGSTGQPKGAMNTHRAICNRLTWMQDTFRLTPSDSVLQKTPFSFDVSVWEFFWPLMTGAKLVMSNPGGHVDPAYLVQMINEHQITVLHFVPSMLQVFLDQPGLRENCKSIRAVICSGEALSYDLQNRFFASLDAELHNLYGPTEAAVDVTHWPCQRNSTESVVPIGWPITNTQIRILDEQLQPVPIGAEGELHIGGVQVGRGYLNRPNLTRERFIEDPFSETPGARLYKSGDLARWRRDGAIEYCGRIDHQVKIRGFRVDLGEIEATLEGIDSINQAAVLVRKNAAGDHLLVAYYVSTSTRPIDEQLLRDELGATLPDYFVPQHFIHMLSMPTTPNGKLDRGKLPGLVGKRNVSRQAISDPVENYLSHLWAKTLGIEFINRNERFFEIGGTSLIAARIVNQLHADLGEFIYVISMFEAPTVADYAEFLRRDYPDALEAELGFGSKRSRLAEQIPQPLSDADVASFEQAIPLIECERNTAKSIKKNPRAIFVLAPPRSGTTLLRVMLAGHPELFAASELQLLCFETLKHRKRAFSGNFSLWLEGTIRSIMDIKRCDASDATAIMEEMEASNLTTRECYRRLQDWIEPRVLVDKSPSYALDPGALRKAESDFTAPIYVHLSRHPLGMIDSFDRYHIEQVLFLKQHDYRGKRLGELIWNISHRNILTFFENIPSERQYSIRFEDLVASPSHVMQGFCDRVGLPYTEELVRPYSNIEHKMVDGVHEESIPMGDTRLLERKKIDTSAAVAWKNNVTRDFLSASTWEFAERLGYRRKELKFNTEVEESTRQDRLQRSQSRRSQRLAVRQGLKQNG